MSERRSYMDLQEFFFTHVTDTADNPAEESSNKRGQVRDIIEIDLESVISENYLYIQALGIHQQVKSEK